MEIFDICDENGQPTGRTVSREKAHAEGIRHRTAHVWILKKEDGVIRVLLQKRSQDKDSFPGMYDTSSAGHIPAGKEPVESALRELKEELGITAGAEDLLYIGRFRISYEKIFRNRPFRDNEVTWVYLLQKPVKDEMITVQKEEVERTDWFDLKEVYEECLAGSERFCVNVKGLEVLKQYLEQIGEWQ